MKEVLNMLDGCIHDTMPITEELLPHSGETLHSGCASLEQDLSVMSYV